MRILIADDEYLARASLRSMLEELNLPLDFVSEAANGDEMVAMVRQHLPDVAFVDIRMPRINGLEAIRIGRSASPQTRWYILTGFPEFDYAQEAIRLGVSGYLLKPVNPEELGKVLDDFIKENRKQKAAQNKQFERELIALNYGLTSLELEERESVILKSRFMGAVFYFDSYLKEQTKAARQLSFCRILQERIDQFLDNYNRIALFVLPGGELATVGVWEPVQSTQAEQRVREYFHAIDAEARQSSSDELAVTVLSSKECLTYQDLQDQFERLLKLAPLRVIYGIGKKLDLTMLSQGAGKPGYLDFSNLVLNICRAYGERNYLNTIKALQQLEKFSLHTPIPENSILTKTAADFLSRSVNCRLPSTLGIKQWKGALQQHAEGLLDETAKDEIQGIDLIDQVISFIDENYPANIGIGQIAERLNITPNYLSTLFHKKTGINFMSYLKRIRMLKAKEMLADPNIQIQQVAERVGYFSARHFSRLFAEHYGCLPSEYRDRLKNR
jgi:two-component system, response regulator YesN